MEIVDCRVPLSQIGKTVGPSPVERFIENVRRHGIVVPVLLREVVSDDGELRFGIIDGNRRVAAARHLGHPDVPARVVSGIDSNDAARLTLTGNNFRSANDITEFWAIKHLERSGQPRGRIADDAGISAKYLENRNRWSTLDRRIFVGFAEGKIAATVANKISRMPPDQQRQLGDLFSRKGHLLTADVERVAGPRRSTRPTSANDVPIAPGVRPGPQPAPDDALSATIVAIPVANEDEAAADGLDHDVQCAVEEVARLASARGIDLDVLVDALTIAYRATEFTMKKTQGAVSG